MTSFDCPIRCARAWAWMSLCGLKSESKMITVSAVARLIPSPPALVDSRNTLLSVVSLNRLMLSCRSLPLTFPSTRSYVMLRPPSHSSRMSSMLVNWEKMMMRWSRSISLATILSISWSLPETLSSFLKAFWPVARPRTSNFGSNMNGWLQHFRSSMRMFFEGPAAFAPAGLKAWSVL